MDGLYHHLLAAVNANPDDGTARLQLADWLEENDRGDGQMVAVAAFQRWYVEQRMRPGLSRMTGVKSLWRWHLCSARKYLMVASWEVPWEVFRWLTKGWGEPFHDRRAFVTSRRYLTRHAADKDIEAAYVTVWIGERTEVTSCPQTPCTAD